MKRSHNTIPSPGRPVMGPSRSVIPTSTGSSDISPAKRNTTAGSPSRRSSEPSCESMTSRSTSATFGIEQVVGASPVALPGLRTQFAPRASVPGVSPLANDCRPCGAGFGPIAVPGVSPLANDCRPCGAGFGPIAVPGVSPLANDHRPCGAGFGPIAVPGVSPLANDCRPCGAGFGPIGAPGSSPSRGFPHDRRPSGAGCSCAPWSGPGFHPGSPPPPCWGCDIAEGASRLSPNWTPLPVGLVSGDDFPDRPAVVDLQPLAAGDLELARIEAELVQDGGVDVGDVVAILDGVEADLVGRALHDTSLDPAAGQPGAETLRVVVAAIRLGAGRPAELGAPDDDRLIEQPAPLEVPQQAGDR